MKPIKRILIDGDILVYRAACAAQKSHYEVVEYETRTTHTYPVGSKKADIEKEWLSKGYTENEYGVEKHYTAEDVSHALYNAKSMLSQIRSECEELFRGSQCLFKLFLTSDDKSNYRFGIAKTKPYKGNRVEPKPIHYDAVRTYLQDQHAAEVIYNQEADDELGILQTQYGLDSCIVSIDKDLLMIPGHHYNFVKKEFHFYQPTVAWYHLCKQLLTGDTVDNIPGLRGIGPKKAHNIVHPMGRDLPIYNEVYMEWIFENVRQAYNDDVYLTEQLQLLWIRRKRDELITLQGIKEYFND